MEAIERPIVVYKVVDRSVLESRTATFIETVPGRVDETSTSATVCSMHRFSLAASAVTQNVGEVELRDAERETTE